MNKINIRLANFRDSINLSNCSKKCLPVSCSSGEFIIAMMSDP